MQRLFAGFKALVSEFITQRQDVLLVVSASENDLGVLLTVLRDLEQETGEDPFLMFGGEFREPVSFMDGVTATLQEEVALTSEAMEKEGRPPLPPIPTNVVDRERPVAERMLDAITYARSLLEPESEQRLVWILCPTEVSDWNSYGLLIDALSPKRGRQRWMRGVRLIVRDDGPVTHLHRVLGQTPFVKYARADFGPEAQQAVLEEASQDAALTDERRAQALFSLAVIDHGYNRAELAIERFDQALELYQKTGNPAMEAMTRRGLGEVYERNEDLERARHWYETAVVPASESKAPVVLSMVAESLGALEYKEQRYDEAYAYYDLCDQLSGQSLDVGAKVRALEHKGLCEEARLELKKAAACFEAAEGLCRKLELADEARRELLAHLERVYGRLGEQEKAVSAHRALEALGG